MDINQEIPVVYENQIVVELDRDFLNSELTTMEWIWLRISGAFSIFPNIDDSVNVELAKNGCFELVFKLDSDIVKKPELYVVIPRHFEEKKITFASVFFKTAENVFEDARKHSVARLIASIRMVVSIRFKLFSTEPSTGLDSEDIVDYKNEDDINNIMFNVFKKISGESLTTFARGRMGIMIKKYEIAERIELKIFRDISIINLTSKYGNNFELFEIKGELLKGALGGFEVPQEFKFSFNYTIPGLPESYALITMSRIEIDRISLGGIYQYVIGGLTSRKKVGDLSFDCGILKYGCFNLVISKLPTMEEKIFRSIYPKIVGKIREPSEEHVFTRAVKKSFVLDQSTSLGTHVFPIISIGREITFFWRIEKENSKDVTYMIRLTGEPLFANQNIEIGSLLEHIVVPDVEDYTVNVLGRHSGEKAYKINDLKRENLPSILKSMGNGFTIKSDGRIGIPATWKKKVEDFGEVIKRSRVTEGRLSATQNHIDELVKMATEFTLSSIDLGNDLFALKALRGKCESKTVKAALDIDVNDIEKSVEEIDRRIVTVLANWENLLERGYLNEKYMEGINSEYKTTTNSMRRTKELTLNKINIFEKSCTEPKSAINRFNIESCLPESLNPDQKVKWMNRIKDVERVAIARVTCFIGAGSVEFNENSVVWNVEGEGVEGGLTYSPMEHTVFLDSVNGKIMYVLLGYNSSKWDRTRGGRAAKSVVVFITHAIEQIFKILRTLTAVEGFSKYVPVFMGYGIMGAKMYALVHAPWLIAGPLVSSVIRYGLQFGPIRKVFEENLRLFGMIGVVGMAISAYYAWDPKTSMGGIKHLLLGNKYHAFELSQWFAGEGILNWSARFTTMLLQLTLCSVPFWSISDTFIKYHLRIGNPGQLHRNQKGLKAGGPTWELGRQISEKLLNFFKDVMFCGMFSLFWSTINMSYWSISNLGIWYITPYAPMYDPYTMLSSGDFYRWNYFGSYGTPTGAYEVIQDITVQKMGFPESMLSSKFGGSLVAQFHEYTMEQNILKSVEEKLMNLGDPITKFDDDPSPPSEEQQQPSLSKRGWDGKFPQDYYDRDEVLEEMTLDEYAVLCMIHNPTAPRDGVTPMEIEYSNGLISNIGYTPTSREFAKMCENASHMSSDQLNRERISQNARQYDAFVEKHGDTFFEKADWERAFFSSVGGSIHGGEALAKNLTPNQRLRILGENWFHAVFSVVSETFERKEGMNVPRKQPEEFISGKNDGRGKRQKTEKVMHDKPDNPLNTVLQEKMGDGMIESMKKATENDPVRKRATEIRPTTKDAFDFITTFAIGNATLTETSKYESIDGNGKRKEMESISSEPPLPRRSTRRRKSSEAGFEYMRNKRSFDYSETEPEIVDEKQRMSEEKQTFRKLVKEISRGFGPAAYVWSNLPEREGGQRHFVYYNPTGNPGRGRGWEKKRLRVGYTKNDGSTTKLEPPQYQEIYLPILQKPVVMSHPKGMRGLPVSEFSEWTILEHQNILHLVDLKDAIIVQFPIMGEMASDKIFSCGKPFFVVPTGYAVLDEDVFDCNWHRWIMGLPAKRVIGGFEARHHHIIENSFIGSEEFMTRLQAQGNVAKALRAESRKGAIVITHLLDSEISDRLYEMVTRTSTFASKMKATEKE